MVRVSTVRYDYFRKPSRPCPPACESQLVGRDGSERFGKRCHELRLDDPEKDVIWRVYYRVDGDAIVVLECICKKTQKTPKSAIDLCKQRLARYDKARAGK